MSGLWTAGALLSVALGTRILGLRLWIGYTAIAAVGALAMASVYGLTFAWANGWLLGGRLWPSLNIDRAYHDTYYVVAHWQYLATGCLLFALPAIAHFVTRTAADTRIDVAVFWALLLGWIAQGSLVPLAIGRLGMPRRYVDASEILVVLNTVQTWLLILLLVIWVLSVGLRFRYLFPKP